MKNPFKQAADALDNKPKKTPPQAAKGQATAAAAKAKADARSAKKFPPLKNPVGGVAATRTTTSKQGGAARKAK